MAEPEKTAPPAAQSPIFVKTHDLLLWLLAHTARGSFRRSVLCD